MMFHSLFATYKPLILQLTLSFSLSVLLHFLSLPTFFLRGLSTYIHPDDVNPNKPQSGGAPKVAIRSPSDYSNQGINGFQSLSSKTTADLRIRKKAKDKFEFDEGKAQIFRLRLVDAHLASRIYFDSYRSTFNCFFVTIACLCLHKNLDLSDKHGILESGSLVPVLLGGLGLFRVFVALVQISLDRSAFKRSERQLGLMAAGLGLFVGIVISLEIYPSIFDFNMKEIDGYGRLCMTLLCGCTTGCIYLAARKIARAFWLGTDQIRCKLPIISCEWFTQLALYGSYLFMAFTSMLWIKPLSGLLIDNLSNSKSARVLDHKVADSERLFGNVGMAPADFSNFRLLCLAISGVVQLFVLRVNLQLYLNEAVLSWYQRLHASKVPELDYSRAKVFIHNHYLCLALIQFFAPGALMLLFLGLSQLNLNDIFKVPELMSAVLPSSAFDKDVAVFMAWWVTFSWTAFTSLNLFLYRRGILYIS